MKISYITKYLIFFQIVVLFSCGSANEHLKFAGYEYEFNQKLKIFLKNHKDAFYDDSTIGDTIYVNLGRVIISENLNNNDVIAVFVKNKLAMINYKFYYTDRNNNQQKTNPFNLNKLIKKMIESEYHMVAYGTKKDYFLYESRSFISVTKKIRVQLQYPVDSLVNNIEAVSIEFSPIP